MNLPVFALLQHGPAAEAGEATAKVNLLSPSGGLMFWTLVIFLILFAILEIGRAHV